MNEKDLTGSIWIPAVINPLITSIIIVRHDTTEQTYSMLNHAGRLVHRTYANFQAVESLEESLSIFRKRLF